MWDGLLVEALAHSMFVYLSVILGKNRGVYMTSTGLMRTGVHMRQSLLSSVLWQIYLGQIHFTMSLYGARRFSGWRRFYSPMVSWCLPCSAACVCVFACEGPEVHSTH